MIEEIHDVYLAYMYDIDLKSQLIKDLIANVFNGASSDPEDEHMQESASILDSQIIADYITGVGREY